MYDVSYVTFETQTPNTTPNTGTGDVFRVRLREENTVTQKEVSSTTLRFNSKDKVWIEKRQTIQTNGVTEIVHFILTPVSNGILLGRERKRNVRWRMEERENMILFTGWNEESDEVMFLETITLMKDGDRRVRTLQIFENGSIVEIVTTCERRRIGVGNGAVVPVDS